MLRYQIIEQKKELDIMRKFLKWGTGESDVRRNHDAGRFKALLPWDTHSKAGPPSSYQATFLLFFCRQFTPPDSLISVWSLHPFMLFKSYLRMWRPGKVVEGSFQKIFTHITLQWSFLREHDLSFSVTSFVKLYFQKRCFRRSGCHGWSFFWEYRDSKITLNIPLYPQSAYVF